MQVRYYRKRPLTVEAVRISTWNVVDVAAWCSGEVAYVQGHCAVRYVNVNGVQHNFVGDWMLRGVGGEFYRVKHVNFHDLYVEEPTPGYLLRGPEAHPSPDAGIVLPSSDSRCGATPVTPPLNQPPRRWRERADLLAAS
ncbi:hypothetical protein A8924_3728 [Saccharopolyspora erythraea NRRL 2338]|nr:hypothetical protein [Saccharopolyspora erythraea]EQD82775.1 hypothetical protein N599_28780 [Saccharopolyspora erythraea D]PFG96335.1 hypothetical protein A8924_3728 [Saccharopolyspora erythraea NRRL 2338]QRK92850.1 hypothetical protein JQX30_17070 [Saccharopolyspora erythraea]